MAGFLALGPTLGGILGAGATLAGKEILKAFLAKKLLGGGDQEEKPGFQPTRKERRNPWEMMPTPANSGIPVSYNQSSLADSPILQAYFGRG